MGNAVCFYKQYFVIEKKGRECYHIIQNKRIKGGSYGFKF